MIYYSAVIHLNPATKKNSMEIHKNPSKTKEWVAQCKRYTDYARAAKLLLPPLRDPITDPVNVKCIFYRKTRHRVDLTNLLGCIDDVLKDTGIILDDHCGIVVSHDGSRVHFDKDDPRTEILITEAKDEDQN